MTSLKLINYLKIMERKIPFIPLAIQFAIVNNAYSQCTYQVMILIELDFGYIFPLLCLLCFIWESFHAWTFYNKIIPLYGLRKTFI